ncbi:MAG: GNAT family N-acetyltransferase [Tabrizicola sp.]|nr:GNAT family N-acetyltransferase [Tabrizicola sp.]
MMLERREVTRDTLHDLIRLSVRDDQPGLVTPNVVTLAEAPYETGSRVWGLWAGTRAVGLMAMVHPDLYRWHEPGDDTEAAYLWRLMIDRAEQGKGYGRAALEQAVEVAREWDLPRVTAGVTDAPHSKLGFYEHFGFRRTGRIVGGEVEISLTL